MAKKSKTEYLSAKKLGLTEKERCALVKTLGHLQSGKVTDEMFNMDTWFNHVFPMNELTSLRKAQSCGTVGCIGGWSDFFGKYEIDMERRAFDLSKKDRHGLYDLFFNYPDYVTRKQACSAIINYLTTSKPSWNKTAD